MINTLFRLSGSSLLIIALGLIAGLVMWRFAPDWQLSRQEQVLYALCIVAMVAAVMAAWRKYKQRLPAAPEQPVSQVAENRAITPAYISEIRDYLYHHYGRFWRWKVRFVVITGRSRVVDKVIPGLKEAQWLEANGVVIIWGRDVTADAESDTFRALRKLKHCPLNALVLIYETPGRQAIPADTLARKLNERYKQLGWRVPLYLWEVQHSPWSQAGRETQPVGCLLAPRCSPDELAQTLNVLPEQLAPQGVQQGLMDSRYDFLLRLSQQLRSGSVEQLKTLCQPLLGGPYAVPLRGVMFSLPLATSAMADKQRWLPDNSWQGILDDLPSLRLQRAGYAWERSLCQLMFMALGLICTGAGVSYAVNRHAIFTGQQLAAQAANTQQSLEQRLTSLDSLQAHIGQLQYRLQHGAPWYSRFGLNQNERLLAALWPQYASSALPLVRDAAEVQLGKQLDAWIRLPAESGQRSQLSRQVYNHLKAYLMLSQPGKMDAPFFTTTLMQLWPRRDQVSPGIWQLLGPGLLGFMAQNLPEHPEWQAQVDAQRVTATRNALLRVIGMRNADSALYQKVLAQVAHNYADLRLSDMIGDTDARKLFATDSVVPGMFTRQAWQEAIQPAIDKVVNQRRDEIDWVLSDNRPVVIEERDSSPAALKARLTERYFSDYSAVWLGFLNGLRWQPAVTLSDAIDQLTLLADIRQSPLVALMNTLNIQGRTGQPQEALSGALVRSAQNLLRDEKPLAIDQNAGPQGALDATFGPLLSLLHTQGDNSNSLSLQTFLTRVTRVRLKLQQVTNTADPQGMMQALAQTVFQGKSVDVADTRDYGSLLAASLGQEWSGFGQAIFVQPLEHAWQLVLSPTAQSINNQWQNAIVNDWEQDFNHRYPFSPNKQSDASLPLLAQYLRNDTGRITQFVKSNLHGVLRKEGRHWVPDPIAAQGLYFNPEFINALNQLSELADGVFTSGDAGMRFLLMGKPARDVMQTHLIVDQQTLDYHNQLESWQPFIWPDSQWKPRTTLSWVSVKAGERIYADYPGSWGWIRLLDNAQVTMVDSSTYRLSWKAPDNNRLNIMLRTENGQGPLALLALKGFRLPQQVFVEPPSSGHKPASDHRGEK